MAFVVVTDAATGVGTTFATFNGHWTGATADAFGYSVDAKFVWGIGVASPNDTGEANYATQNGSHADTNDPTPIPVDTTIVFEFRARDQDGGFQGGGTQSFRSHAYVMTFGAPHLAAVRDNEADVDIDFNPRTYESTASVKVQYKLTTEPTVWTDCATRSVLLGDAAHTEIYTITGLLANTSYNYRFAALRDTANDTSLTTDGTAVFTTAPIPSGGIRVMWLG